MQTLLSLLERAPTEAAKFADLAATAIVADLGVDEMRYDRGAGFNHTKYYQIRVKPKTKDTPLDTILADIEKYLKKNHKKLGIKQIQINAKSFNSGKYSSVSFQYGDIDFDIVVAAGANKGESFEKDLLLKMDNLAADIEDSEEAKKAFAALEKANPAFKLKNVETIVPRQGRTQRSGDLSSEEIGRIIADIIIKMKGGKDFYVSVKNVGGRSIGQFGISKSFNDDLSIDTSSAEWKTWLAPFGVDPKKVTNGLRAREAGKDVTWDDIERPDKPIKPGSAAFKALEKMWGTNYFYLRETRDGFKAFYITPEFLRDTLLNNLRVTEIRYPSEVRKQISIQVENDTTKYLIEVRNAAGARFLRPNQIQLSVHKSAF